MSTIKRVDPAFPCDRILANADGDERMVSHVGMTLRDYFAAKALQGLLASPGAPGSIKAAEIAYCMADAMLKAREVAP